MLGWTTDAEREDAVRVLGGGRPVSLRRGLRLAWNRPSAPGLLMMLWAYYAQYTPASWSRAMLTLFAAIVVWMGYTVRCFAREQ